MTTVNEVKALFVDDVAARAASIRAFVMDPTNTYEDRLDVYKSTPTHLQYQNNWVFNHPTLKDDDWCQYDWWERHSTVDLTEIPDYGEWDDATTKEWYLGVMDKGVWSFVFDW